MNLRSSFGLLLFGLFLLGLPTLRAGEIVRYDAREPEHDPEARGWKAVRGEEAFGEFAAGEAPGEEAWKIGSPQSNVNTLIYRRKVEGALLSGEWVARARLRVLGASAAKVEDAYLAVEDGKNRWSLGFIKLRHSREEIAFVNADRKYETLLSCDLSTGFVTVEMHYRPETDEVSVSVNGEPVERPLRREEMPTVPNAARVGIQWGDGSVAALPADARSEVDWQSVVLETVP